jgi:PAS domain S-box-containing protein
MLHQIFEFFRICHWGLLEKLSRCETCPGRLDAGSWSPELLEKLDCRSWGNDVESLERKSGKQKMPLLFKTFKKLLRPFPVGFLYIVFLIVLSWRLGTPTPAHSQAVPDAKVNPPLGEGATAAGIPPDLSKKNVLLLHAYTYETASSMVMDPIFVKGFKEAGLATFNLHFEFMDLAKHPEPAHRRKFVQYLGRKFEKQPIDLIIALHSPALNFLVEEGRNLFPGVPVINVIAGTEFLRNEKLGNAYESRLRPLKRPFVILASSMDVESTVKSIVSLRPDTQTLVVISGSSVLDRMMEEAARRGLQAWQGRLQIEYFSARPLEQVLKQVATLSPKTVILFSNFSADPDGSVYSPPEVVRRINRAANAPVFGLYDTLLGNGGIVGGVMLITFRGEAIRTVQLALEMLRGRLPTEPVTISRTPLIPMFDWEQLKRWALNENRLPPGSIVLNRPGTIWTEYKGFVIGSMAVFLAQALLVIGLLVQRDLKRKAESYLRQKTEELDQFFEVSLDLLGIANTDGNFLRLNPAWERILGHSREELMAKRFLEFVHPDDLDRTREAISALRSQQKVLSFENRYRCKDGTYRWLQWSSAPAGKLIYAAARDVTENKQSEEALRKAEEKYRSIFEGALEGIYETSPEGQYLTANPALAKMLGVGSPDEVTSLTKDSALQVWVDPNLREEYARLIEAKGVVLGFEVQFWCKDRTKIWVSISGRRVCGPNGQTLLHSGFIEDITERKGVEEALQEIELKYRRLYESMREAFVKVDMGGRIQEFNSAYQTMLGYSAGELRKKTYQDLIPENWHDKERKIIAEQVLPRGYSEVYEKEYRRKDGTVFPVELRTFLLKDAAGGHSGMWAIVRDITERKRTEEALKQSEERFRQVAENVGDFIWETDANGLYRYTSPSVERILGYRPDELEGKKHFYDLFSPEVRGELKAAALAVFAAKQPLRVFLNKNLSKEGKVVYLETSGAPVLDAAGYLVGYRGADTNVTERRRAEEELSQYREHLEDLVRGRTAELIAARERAEAANQAKSVFLANMSHELRSPLNSILGIAQLMDRDHELSPKHRELLGILGRSGQQLFDLIDDVL